MTAVKTFSAVRLRSRNFGTALALFGNPQSTTSGTGIPMAFAVAVAAVGAFRACFVVVGAASPLDVHVHEALCHKLHHLAQHIDIGATVAF